MENRKTARPANCFKCAHFYVTWDEFFPRGCKALGFKSRELPSRVVFSSSGIECMRFDPRGKSGGGGREARQGKGEE